MPLEQVKKDWGGGGRGKKPESNSIKQIKIASWLPSGVFNTGKCICLKDAIFLAAIRLECALVAP